MNKTIYYVVYVTSALLCNTLYIICDVCVVVVVVVVVIVVVVVVVVVVFHSNAYSLPANSHIRALLWAQHARATNLM